MTSQDWNIDGIQFSILSDDEIKYRSTLEITETKLMNNEEKVQGGLLDERMEDTNNLKPGNFGHIELAKSVYHVGFKDITNQILKCVCFYCSSIICSKDDPYFNNALKIKNKKKRISKIKQVCNKYTNCSVCQLVQPIYNFHQDEIIISFQASRQEKIPLEADHVKSIFSRVSSTDSTLLGFDSRFNKLSSLIISTLLIPPPSVRPTLILDSGIHSQDDMTHKLLDIVKINTILKNFIQIGENEQKIQTLTKLLQYNISTYLDNNKLDIPAKGKSGKTYVSFKNKFDGKTGRIRGNLMGKRVNYSARTVIGGDPSISIDEVGIPYSVAMNVTYPEKVFDLNIDRLRENVKNGPNIYPGAKFIIKNGKKIKIDPNATPIYIENGDIVCRHLNDGDNLILNRQPTLHRLSMMGHKVKILPYSTFRLNLAITEPYNADFDGDEMNIHFPQTLEASTEVREIMMAPQNIMSPNQSEPKTGLVQDSLLGIRKFTLRDTFLKKHTFMNIMMDLENSWNHQIPVPAIVKPNPKWTGKQVVSVLLPNIDMEGKSKGYINFQNEQKFISKNDTYVKIMDGILISGILDKNTIGSKAKSIIHIIYNDMGFNKCTDFINKIQHISNRYLMLRSASVGINDLYIKPEIRNQISNKVDELINDANSKTKENDIIGILGKALKETTNIIKKNWKKENNFYQMYTAGSKGKDKNIGQMMGSIGQNTLSGDRMRTSFKTRTLPHYEKNDNSPVTKGFVKNCYIVGLEPDEFYFHTISGREGITDTAVKTASSGYIQRRFIKTMEDISVKYDGTIRNSMNDILQFFYGGDSLSTTSIELSQVSNLELNLNDFKKSIKISGNSSNNKKLIKEEYNQLIENYNYLHDNNIQNKFYFPYDLDRAILRIQKQTYKNDAISISYIVNLKKTLFENINNMYSIPIQDKTIKEEILNELTRFVKIHIYNELSIKNILYKYKLSKTQYKNLIDYIQNQYEKSLIQSGEVVGITAAQAFGEPTTQMTLNTFHSAGMAGANVTLGVPRVEEIIKFKKKINSPTIYLIPYTELSNDLKYLDKIVNNLQYNEFQDIISECNFVTNNTDSSKFYWKLIIKFNNIKEISEITIKNKIKQFLNSYPNIITEYEISSIKNTEIIILINSDNRKTTKRQSQSLSLLKKNLYKFKITGITGITSAFRVETAKFMNEDGQTSLKKIKNKISSKNMIYVNGSNLQELLQIDGINHMYTICNDMHQIKKTLGLEAARFAFINEMKSVFDFYGIHITKHHYELLADCLMYKGKFMSVDRNGINRRNTGPLTRASFEETFTMFMNAGALGEYDGLFGVSGNVMIGNKPDFGTGLPHIII